MKAIIQTSYGSPDVLELREVEKPAPEPGRVLVKVLASSLNALDYHGTHGFVVRLLSGFRRPKDPRSGTDVAGIVEAVGPDVTRFRPGDAVFGASPGAFAEYASAKQDNLAPKPPNVPFEQAGAVAIAGTTALQGLRDKGHLQAGQSVLINGASGGVGTFAVQIAKAFGAEVTAVCSPRNLETARSIGADHVIDYTKEDFTKNARRYDLILDIVGNHSARACARVLNPGGKCIVVGFGFPRLAWSKLLGHLVSDPVRSRVSDKEVRFMGMAKLNEKDFGILGELLGSGKIVPVIDRRYPLGQVAKAVCYLGEGHARGKVVITVDGEAAGRTAGAAGTIAANDTQTR